jgi:hypothetical protein
MHIGKGNIGKSVTYSTLSLLKSDLRGPNDEQQSEQLDIA